MGGPGPPITDFGECAQQPEHHVHLYQRNQQLRKMAHVSRF